MSVLNSYNVSYLFNLMISLTLNTSEMIYCDRKSDLIKHISRKFFDENCLKINDRQDRQVKI